MNRNKVISFLKKTVITILCVVTTSSAVISAMPLAYASTSILGTDAALGSPILNNNATIDDWNKWEMLCWGVFLSNFCQPLVDDYRSAFQSGYGGSNGKGYEALSFGTGNNRTNEETIEAFCNQAITYQEQITKKTVYVNFATINNNKITPAINPNSLTDEADIKTKLREARAADFFVHQNKVDIDGIGDDSTYIKLGSTGDLGTLEVDGYESMVGVYEAQLPVFYVKGESGGYIKILDYTESWDMQMAAAIFNAVDKDYQEEFNTKLADYSEGTQPILFDAFGNLTVDGKILFPAAGNQHLTTTDSINLVNSWILNSYSSTYNENTLINGIHQSNDSIFGWYNGSAGGPAMSNVGKGLSNIGLLYYDLDSIAFRYGLKGQKFNYGEALKELFDSDINASKYSIPLKFEIAGTNAGNGLKGNAIKNNSSAQGMVLAAQVIANLDTNTNQPKMLNYIEYTTGEKVKLFDSTPVLIANQTVLPEKESEVTSQNSEKLRLLMNFIYKGYRGLINENTTGKYFGTSTVAGTLSQSKTIDDFSEQVKEHYWDIFTNTYTKYSKDKYADDKFDIFKNETLNEDTQRLILVFPISDVVKAVSSVLGVVDGTEFGAWSSYIYVTYLDWYGILNQTTLTSGTDQISNFNTDLFSPKSELMKHDPGTTGAKSKESMESEVLQMSYLMLHPDDGRNYRKELIYNGISDFLYEQYNRIVYGGASTNYEGSASKSNAGFLAVEAYSNNFLTSWFLNMYVDIAIWLLGICVLAVVVMGLVKSRKFSWFLMSIIIIVNVIILIPSSGDIVPYVTSSMVQKMFSSKLTYWGISEGIANAALESDAAASTNNFDGLDQDEALLATQIIKQMNNIYIDRSLMLKQDISQKLTQQLGGSYTQIQTLQSARWILPTLMQQYTAEEEADDQYVYVSLANVWDDGSNLYWYYNPNEASSVTKDTATSKQFIDGTANTADSDQYSKSISMIGKYVDSDAWTVDEGRTDVNYHNTSYFGDKSTNVHLYSWINENISLPVTWEQAMGDFSDYENADSWQKYMNLVYQNCRYDKDRIKEIKSMNEENKLAAIQSEAGDFLTNSMSSIDNNYEEISDQYNRSDAATLQPGYSYFKTTESPYYYFFNVVKDSLGNGSLDESFGSVIGKLQGQTLTNDEGKKIRNNFMYATIGDESYDDAKHLIADGYTGEVRDVLDLEEMFTNVIPYLYTMTLYTGGFDGESGALLDAKITDESDFYEGHNQSWAYRCNWATKIMENPQFSKPATAYPIYGEGGTPTKMTVNCPVMPASYEAQLGRPMIFSEAQMHAYGLVEADLTLVELKCVEVNDRVSEQWTMLINYAGTEGMTKEVLYREMAIIATNEFCQEFSTSGIINNKYSIYPQSLDLRYLSFDSVMKLLMINVSKDTRYVYGDTMSTLIENTDLLTAALLLVDAFLCAALVPLVRCILMAMIFYLGFLAIIQAIFSSAQYKGKIACGQLISNLLFMVYTIIYYAAFSGLMSISTSDAVLTENVIKASPGNPIWMLLAVMLISCVYVVAMFKQIEFCFKHYRDMGFEVYSTVASAVTGKMQDAFDGLGNKISDGLSGEKESKPMTSNTNSVKGTGSMSKKQTGYAVNIVNNGTAGDIGVSYNNDFDSDEDDMFKDKAYEYESGEEWVIEQDSSVVDEQIKVGEQMEQNKD